MSSGAVTSTARCASAGGSVANTTRTAGCCAGRRHRRRGASSIGCRPAPRSAAPEPEPEGSGTLTVDDRSAAACHVSLREPGQISLRFTPLRRRLVNDRSREMTITTPSTPADAGGVGGVGGGAGSVTSWCFRGSRARWRPAPCGGLPVCGGLERGGRTRRPPHGRRSRGVGWLADDARLPSCGAQLLSCDALLPGDWPRWPLSSEPTPAPRALGGNRRSGAPAHAYPRPWCWV